MLIIILHHKLVYFDLHRQCDQLAGSVSYQIRERIFKSSRFSNEITLSLSIVAYLSGLLYEVVNLHVKPDTPLFFQPPPTHYFRLYLVQDQGMSTTFVFRLANTYIRNLMNDKEERKIIIDLLKEGDNKNTVPKNRRQLPTSWR